MSGDAPDDPTASPIAGRRLLLTGASGGIGRVIATALSAQGASLALAGRDRSRLAPVAAQCGQQAAAGPVATLLADAETADPDGLVRDAQRALGGLDGVILAAGVVTYEAFPDVSPAALSRQLAVNCVFPLRLAQATARQLQQRGGGDIIAITSTLAERPAPMTGAYAASKAALTMGLRTMALELGPAQVRVNAIAPGVIDTDMVRVPRLQPGEGPLTPAARARRIEEQLEALRTLHLLGRLGEPEDLIGAVSYLLKSPWVTGTVLTVDGGLGLS